MQNPTSQEHTYDVVVIGGGPGGLTAGIYASRSGLSTLVLEKMAPGGQLLNTYDVDNVPGFPEGIQGMELAQKLEQQAKRFGTELKMAEIQEVDLQNQHKLVKFNDQTIQARNLIIATGERPKKLGVAGEETLIGRGVSYCATCDGAFFKNQRVAVVGGGDSAIAEAIFLTRLAEKVTVIHRRNQLRAVQYLQNKAFNHEKIDFKLNTVVNEIRGEKKVESLLLEDTNSGAQKEMDCEGVFIYVGSDPNTGLLKNTPLEMENGYLLANEEMETNVPGVYAVGDVRKKTLRQVVTAMSDGAIAAFNAEKALM